ncbi:MAG: Flp pilus assembly complex ATPase component TadA [Spirochaetaceae bacterium]|jgi:type II secretory ATPase GspE/PulE/Tfp pilus assembly ATPase PilB-like protein|nr:Flp pilus assembly complex ATPase component TadA [Spirochaetaceae bacterium]
MKPFFLSPVFCLHNGVAILDQAPTEISFGLVDTANESLCRRLEKSFLLWLKENGLREGAVHFVKIDKDKCAREVSRLFAPETQGGRPALPEAEQGLPWKEESPAIALLDSLIAEAVAQGATDIHIEGPSSRGVQVRFRVWGALREHIVFNEKTAESLVLRIKNLARLNTLEKRRPQDGQFMFDRDRVCVRVSCIPALRGESVALRLLDSARVPLEPEKLGFTRDALGKILSLLDCADGLILVCGPTGSGKSTTLASLLSLLHTRANGAKKIITIEDPVEYVLDGITQIQTNTAVSLDFDEILRRVFRQDPDIIMLGEIRDSKTASVALSASLTGHLVFATLHTTGKDESIIRLKDLGAEEQLIRSVLRGVISQRLIHGDRGLRLEGDVSVLGRTA